MWAKEVSCKYERAGWVGVRAIACVVLFNTLEATNMSEEQDSVLVKRLYVRCVVHGEDVISEEMTCESWW